MILIYFSNINVTILVHKPLFLCPQFSSNEAFETPRIKPRSAQDRLPARLAGGHSQGCNPLA